MSVALSIAIPVVPSADMPRRGPKKTQLGTYIPAELHEALQTHSDTSGIPITRIVEDALRAYLAQAGVAIKPITGAAQ